MDDEITNAINSLEGNTVNNDSQGINITASDNLSSSDMPPITRPEDVLAGLSDSASIEVPISSSQENTIPLKNDLEQRLGEHDVQLMEIYTVMEQFLDDKTERKKWENRKKLGYK